MPSFQQRLAQAHRATSVAQATHPGYPDPTSKSDWADLPAVLIGVDLEGREDIEHTFMLDGRILTVADAWLGIAPLDDKTWAWLLGVEFENDLADLEIASIATSEMIDLFCEAELLLIATEARAEDRCSEVFPLVVAPNDPARWSSMPRPAMQVRRQSKRTSRRRRSRKR